MQKSTDIARIRTRSVCYERSKKTKEEKKDEIRKKTEEEKGERRKRPKNKKRPKKKTKEEKKDNRNSNRSVPLGNTRLRFPASPERGVLHLQMNAVAVRI